MKHLILCLMLATPLAPALAQDGQDDMDQGMALLQEGARSILRGFMTEVEPKMDEMGRALDGLGSKMGEALDEAQPYLTGLMALMDDIGNYSAPEKLPNGDIIIRRKPDAVIPPEMMGPQIDL